MSPMNILGIAPRRSVNKIGVYMVFDFLKKNKNKQTPDTNDCK